jgi:long-subunit fatty acid transport protein
LYTYGNGFSFQLGAIVKATKEIRLGLAYQSPTFYNLNDELSQSLTVVSEKEGSNSVTDTVNPDVINTYQPYKLQTPDKITGSFAYVFGKTGLLSVDYSRKNYGNTQYNPNNEFRDVNNGMSNLLTKTGELRIGGEYKIKQWSLRGGYRFEESPYKNKTTFGDLTGYSGGLGYNFGSTKLDVSYSTSKRDSNQRFFSQGFTDSSAVNTTNNNVSLTLLFEL